MTQLFTNNGQSTLNGAILIGDTSITLNDTTDMPTPSGADYFLLTLTDFTDMEVIKVTDNAANVLTVVRGHEGTAQAWGDATVCQVNVTKDTLEEFPQLNSANAFTGDNTFTQAELVAIASEVNAGTIVDVFVYNTSKDSDGGQWREGTAHTSWYNETLNTSTRGSTKIFPAVALIVVEATKVTFYDATDSSLPMWMVFEGGNYRPVFTASTNSSVAMNGEIFIAGNSNSSIVSFTKDKWEVIRDLIAGIVYGLKKRNNTLTAYEGVNNRAIVNGNVNDVAFTVEPNAPIDSETGLPILTIAVMTDGNSTYSTSIFSQDGNVYDVADDTTGTAVSGSINSDGALTVNRSDGTVYIWDNVGSISADGTSPDTTLSASSTPALLGASSVTNNFAFGSTSGLSILSDDKQMVARGSSDIPLHWQFNDIQRSWLAYASSSSIESVKDRSVNASNLTANGTITHTQVATGAELYASSGFSAANYYQEAFSADLDYSTTSFHGLIWLKEAANTVLETVLDRDSSTSAQRFGVQINTTGTILFVCDDNTTTRTATSSVTVDDDAWHLYMYEYDGVGGLNLYQDGDDTAIATASGAALLTLNNATATFNVGLDAAGANPLTNGSALLCRTSAGNMSMVQWAKTYEDERWLFQEDAQCTLGGSSDSVTALDFDEATELLHVATSTDTSVFKGLQRVDTTTEAVTSISAHNDTVMKGA